MSKHHSSLSALAVLWGLSCLPAQAEIEMLAMAEEDLMLLYGDDETISIATGTQKPIHLAPSVASVITAKDIKASGARLLDEVLEMVPGLHVSLSVLNRLNPVYSVRGIHTGMNPHVLLLVNGVRLFESINGGRLNDYRIPVTNIERIEVIRGPGSAVYGAEAFSGVINIITKKADDINGTVLGARAGSFDTLDAWLQSSFKLGQWDVAASLEYANTEGDDGRSVNADLQTGFDGLFGTSASLAPGTLATDNRQLNTTIAADKDHWSLFFNGWNQDGGVGAGAAQALDPVGSNNQDSYLLALDYNDLEITQNWQLDAHLSYKSYDLKVRYQILPPGARVPIGADGNLLTPPGCVTPSNHSVFGPICLVDFPDGFHGNPGGKEHTSHLELVSRYDGLADHHIRLAIGVEQTDINLDEQKNFGPGIIDGSVTPINGNLTDVTGTADIFMLNKERTVNYFSLQDEWRLAPDWELVAGVRYDDYSDFGDTTNPRLALVWATDYNLTTKFLYGRAFRAPSFGELYYENNPIVLGNSALQPERIDMFELVFDYRPSFTVQSVLNLFAYQADDLIEYVSGMAQNVGKQDGHGFEFELNWQAAKNLKLRSYYALQLSKNKKTNADVHDAPQRSFYLAGDWSFTSRWSLNPQLNWIADRPRASSDGRAEIGDYTLVDLSLRHQSDSAWEYAAKIGNLFDADAREPSNGTIPDDYPLAGRSIYLEVRYHLGQ